MKKVKVEFTGKNLTGQAGFIHMEQFIRKLGLHNILERHITIERGDNARYSVADAVTMLAMGALAGAKHMAHIALLRTDQVIRRLLDWEAFPDDCTFGRMFKLFTHAHCHELAEAEAEARKKVWDKRWFGRITLDVDSTVETVYGKQEGAVVGYNPENPGHKSYHPLLCFIAENRECLHNWHRTGSAYSANGSVEFMKECLARLPKRVWKIMVRADSAFFDGALLDYLEWYGCQYLIKVKLKNLVELLMAQEWRKSRHNSNIETAEFMYQCAGWKRARRFVAVRILVGEETEGLLFPKPVYQFFCYATNQLLTPWETHKCYGQRATSENWIEWCKNQVAAGSIRTQDFWANSALFQTCILAYNLMVWMTWFTTGCALSQEPNTIRAWLLHVPARLISSGGQWILKLPVNYVFKEQWECFECSLSTLCFT